MLYDVIIVGGGPAGLTAALYARRANKTALIIEKATFGGQITHSPKVENIPGFVALSGNQIGALLLDYVLARLKENGKLTDKGFVVKSFVTTALAKLIADDYGVELMETPVGFKFIGEKIKQFDDTGLREFIFGFEESCGYLRGTHCRDKDAVVASMLFAEMVCYYNSIGKNIYQVLMKNIKF